MRYYYDFDTQSSMCSQSIIYNWVREGSTVLDLGCASGNMGDKLHNLKNCLCHGVEYDYDNRLEALETKAYETVAAVDLNNLDPTRFPEWLLSFDYVIAGDVLEHLVDPVFALKRIRHFIKPNGGQLLISLPNISHASVKGCLMKNLFPYADTGILDRTHLRFFTAGNVVRFLARGGFEVVEATGTLPSDMANYDACYEGLPPEVLWHIFHNVHSYILQYVCRCVPSELPEDELARRNLPKLDFSLDDFCGEFVDHVWRTIARFCPDEPASASQSRS